MRPLIFSYIRKIWNVTLIGFITWQFISNVGKSLVFCCPGGYGYGGPGSKPAALGNCLLILNTHTGVLHCNHRCSLFHIYKCFTVWQAESVKSTFWPNKLFFGAICFVTQSVLLSRLIFCYVMQQLSYTFRLRVFKSSSVFLSWPFEVTVWKYVNQTDK